MKKCKITIIQPRIKPNKIDHNVSHVLELIAKCVKKHKPSLVVLSETVTTGFETGLSKNDLYNLISENQNLVLDSVKNVAKNCQIYICLPSYEIHKQRIYNSAFLISPKGKLLYTYRKIQLYPPEKIEHGGYITNGDCIKVIKTKIGRIGILTCHDADYPYIHQWLLNQRVEIIIRAAAFRRSKNIWQFSNQFLAFACNAYVLAANSIGKDGKKNYYYGQSLIIDPNGKILARVMDQEKIISITLNSKSFDYNNGIKKVYSHHKDLDKKAYKKFLKS